MEVEFRRLTEVSLDDLAELFNHPDVRRHLPLAKGTFTTDACADFVAAKERMWADHGYGPWAFFVGGRFAGWGGLQPEDHDVDLGIVLHPRYWGLGRALAREILGRAFGPMGHESVTVLLPPSRTRVRALRRLGFEEDGRVVLAGERFVRYRAVRPSRVHGTRDVVRAASVRAPRRSATRTVCWAPSDRTPWTGRTPMDKQSLDGMWDLMRMKYGVYLRVLEAIPADRFGDRPVAGMRTPTQMVVHASGSIVRDIAEGVSSGTIQADEAGEDGVAARLASKDDVLEFARTCWDRADAAIAATGDEQLAAAVGNPWGMELNGAFAMTILNDEFLHHRGQLYAFVRACGAEPPFMWGFQDNAEGFRPQA